MTFLNHTLFVVSGEQQVDVYEERPMESAEQVYGGDDTQFVLTPQILINDAKRLVAIVACIQNKCLYISDVGKKEIYKYDPVKKTVLTRWAVGEQCFGLSLTRSNSLLCTLIETKRAREYSPVGGVIREIKFPSSVDRPQHCIQLYYDNTFIQPSNDDQFVVSQEGMKKSRVCIVDTRQRIIKESGGLPGSGVGQLYVPRFMAVDAHGRVMVADVGANRVVVLSPTLVHLGYVKVPGCELYSPRAIHFDEVNDRLYIGRWWGTGELFVLHVDISESN